VAAGKDLEEGRVSNDRQQQRQRQQQQQQQQQQRQQKTPDERV